MSKTQCGNDKAMELYLGMDKELYVNKWVWRDAMDELEDVMEERLKEAGLGGGIRPICHSWGGRNYIVLPLGIIRLDILPAPYETPPICPAWTPGLGEPRTCLWRF